MLCLCLCLRQGTPPPLASLPNAPPPHRCNPPTPQNQMTALRAGLDGTPLVLIQGPPGTGKTRTILNLLSVVMHAAAKGSLELMPIAGGVNENGSSGSGGALAAAATGASREAAAAAAASRGSARLERDEGRQYLWALQSPWMFGLPARRDAVGPWPRECVAGMIGWLVGWFSGWLVGWLVGWLGRALIRTTRPILQPYLMPVLTPPPPPLTPPLHPSQTSPSTAPTPGQSTDCFGLTRTPPVAAIGQRSGPKAHVLVCAPSNSALDEIVLRVVKMVGWGLGLDWGFQSVGFGASNLHIASQLPQQSDHSRSNTHSMHPPPTHPPHHTRA